MRYLAIDGCACPRPLSPVLKKLKRKSGNTYNSIYRGEDAAALLHRFGKHTQAELFATLPAGVANPPGRSTHELRSDGVPYPGPIGRKLKWWQCGIDINDSQVDHAIATAHSLGWTLFRPYGSGVEYHHVNFAHRPARWRLLYHAIFKPKPKKKAPRPTHLSEDGAKFIAGFEGFRSAPYQDSVGVWTIGYGHTHGVGPGSKHITKAEGLKLLQADAKVASTAIRDLVHVRLNQHQFDALVSFTFNLGTGAFASSTLLKKLNRGDYKGAANEFGRWTHAGGQVLQGLVTRRRAEAHLFRRKP